MALLYLCNNTAPVSVANELRKGLTLTDMFKSERKDTLVNIGAHVLMPNHFHILVHEKTENGISTFMKKLSTAYSMYFNTKYERTGNLFEGRFKATHVNNDKYLKYLFSYIHLNPVKLIDSEWKENGIKDKKKAQTFLQDYQYSSYLDHQDARRAENAILYIEPFPRYFTDELSFRQHVNDWLEYDE